MSVTDGQAVNAAVTNAAFMSRTVNTSTVGTVTLNNTTNVNSGAQVTNAQRAVNETFDAVGMTGEGDTTRKDYSSNNYVANGDSHKVAIGKLDTALSTAVNDKVDKVSPSTDDGIPRFANTVGDLQNSGVTIDDTNNMNIPGNLIVAGDLTVQGTTTTIDAATLQVEDPNILINRNGTQATADSFDSGITVEMTDATDAFIGYDSTATSRFKAGDVGSGFEILTAGHIQTVSAKKTHTAELAVQHALSGDFENNTATGSNAVITLNNKLVVRLTDSGLVSVNNIASYVTKEIFVLINVTGNDITIINDSGGTAADRIITGTGADLTLSNNAGLILYYDSVASRNRVLAGASAGGGGGTAPAPSKYYVVDPLGGDNTYTTIQDAIDQADTDGHAFPNGATILIRPGQYVESLTISTNINLSSLSNDFNFGNAIIVGAHTLTCNAGNINTNVNSFSGLSLVSTSAAPALTVTGTNAVRVSIGQCNIVRQAGSGPLLTCDATGSIVTMRGGFITQTDTSAAAVFVDDSVQLRVYDAASIQGGLYCVDLDNSSSLDLISSKLITSATAATVVRAQNSSNIVVRASIVNASDVDSTIFDVSGTGSVFSNLIELQTGGTGYTFAGAGTISIGQNSYNTAKTNDGVVTIVNYVE